MSAHSEFYRLSTIRLQWFSEKPGVASPKATASGAFDVIRETLGSKPSSQQDIARRRVAERARVVSCMETERPAIPCTTTATVSRCQTRRSSDWNLS